MKGNFYWDGMGKGMMSKKYLVGKYRFLIC